LSLVRIDKRKRPCGKLRHGWDDNIKIYLKKGSVSVDWFNLIQDQGQWHTFADGMSLWVPSK
jgi:hypothetical protein